MTNPTPHLKSSQPMKVILDPIMGETCHHHVPIAIECGKCKREEAILKLPEDHPVCIHGEPEGLCATCDALAKQAEMEERDRGEIERQTKLELARIAGLKENPETKLRECGIPKKYLFSSFENFAGNNKLIEGCKEYQSEGLVLTGKTGGGKTHLAVAILRDMVRNDKITEAGFITIPDLLMKIRASFKDDAQETEEEIVDFYSKVPFLILDDLGSEKTTDFAITTLYIIIDRRDRELLSTIITTNLSLLDIEKKLDARIASRLAGMKNIKVDMADYRKIKKAVGAKG